MSRWKTGLLAACAALGVMAHRADADLIIDTMPTNPGAASISRTPGNADGGITTVIDVGASNVEIGSFGTFGQLMADGDVKFVIFADTPNSAPIFSTGPIAMTAAGAAQWYVSPEIDFTLMANTTYLLGLIADQAFTYHGDVPGTAVTSGGLTAVDSDNGNTGPSFANPVNSGDGSVLNSFEAFTPVPEPASLGLLGMAGAVVGAASFRRRLARRG